jgi:hypothetical protein
MAQLRCPSYKREMIDYGSARGLARAGVGCGVLAILIAGCATQPTSVAVPEMPAASPAAAMQEQASLAAPTAPRFERLPEQPPVLPPPEPEPPPPPPPLPEPTDAQSLRAAFGTPALIRREPDSELWRYDGMGCAAFFFLYPDGETYRIRHSETAPRGADMPADPDCLRSLLVPAGASLPGAGM